MKSGIKLAVPFIGLLVAGVSSASLINLNADKEQGNVLTFSAEEKGLVSIGQLGPHEFNQNVPNVNNLEGKYKVQVTVTSPGSLQAYTYCSVNKYTFSAQGSDDQVNTYIAFDKDNGAFQECRHHS